MSSLRDTFPRGLEQPEGAFRSSIDALLLADCALAVLPAPAASLPSTSAPSPLVVDLGTGCGMALCALALRAEHATGVGVDIQPELVEAARHNIAALEMETRWRMEQADAGDMAFMRQLCGTNAAHVVMANPPYRQEGDGRPSAQSLRRTALHGRVDTLSIFCRAARVLLRHHGFFCLIFPPARLGELLSSLREQDMGTRSLRFVHTRPQRAAALVLVTAQKSAAEDITVLPPLTIYADETGEARSAEAHRILFETGY